MANHGYYLPLANNVFEAAHFLGIEARSDGMGETRTQKHNPDGVPVWTLTLLIKRAGSIPEVELFTWTASTEAAQAVKEIPPMTPVTLIGLEAGKWSRANTDRTTWTFRVAGIEPTKR
jgi:hypothetical protein